MADAIPGIDELTNGKVSIHETVQEMYEKIHDEGLSNVFDRFDPQEKIRCGFCSDGVSCQLCTNGHCRISDKAGAELGNCGIDSDAIKLIANYTIFQLNLTQVVF